MTTMPNVPDTLSRAVTLTLRAGHGHQAAVAAALGWPRQRVNDILRGVRPHPFEQSRDFIECCRRNGNAESEGPFLELSRQLGYVSHRRGSTTPTDADDFAGTLREVADVVNAHAAATDGRDDDEDTLDLVRQLRELEEKACAFADRLEDKARQSSPRRIAAWTVRIGKEAK